jgi:cellulose synthase/poly-beta-1,6-N-acetylglucosamine synthase-like glycosyltransferase
VKTTAPSKIKVWYRQKIRWSSGSLQNFINHFKVIIRNPLNIAFFFLYSIINVIFVVSLIKNSVFVGSFFDSLGMLLTDVITLKAFELKYGAGLIHSLVTKIYFVAFSLPFVIPMITDAKRIYRMLYVIFADISACLVGSECHRGANRIGALQVTKRREKGLVNRLYFPIR